MCYKSIANSNVINMNNIRIPISITKSKKISGKNMLKAKSELKETESQLRTIKNRVQKLINDK
jgi:hypothetical protein